MTPASSRLAIAATLVAGLFLLSACVRGTVSPSPSASPSAAASGSASVAPSTSPSATASAASTPATSPSAAADCVVEPQEGPLSSDRMTDVVISSTADADIITFVFGNPSLPGPAGPPRGDLTVAEPPYSEAGSGQLIDMQGDHVLQLRFLQMSLYADTGDATYDGPREFTPDLSVLRHAVEYDATEGQIGWYIGYDGPGCATLGRDGDNVIVAFAHP